MINSFLKKYKNLPIQLKASFWFMISAFMQKGISTITTPIFTRLLTTEEYGQYNVFNSWLGIITIFVSLNLSWGVYTQGLVKFEDDRKVFSSSMQGLSLALSIVWLFIYILFKDSINNILGLSTVQMLLMIMMIWTTAIFNFWASEQRVLYNYKMLVFITIVVSLFKPIIGIIFVVNSSDKVTARIFGLAIVELVAYIGLCISQFLKGKRFFVSKYWKYAVLYNLPLVPHYLSQTVLNSADRIMIKNMDSERSAGIYSLAYSISLIMTLFNTALLQTLNPWIYTKIKQKKYTEISSVGYISLALIAFVNIMLIALAPEVVAIFAPKEYYDAIYVIPPVAMSVYFMFAYDLFAKFAFYYEKTFFIMAASIISAILNIILNYIFIKKFGYVAAGYTTLFCFIIYAVGHYFFMVLVCNKYCDKVRPYKTRYILWLSIIFIFVGFLLLTTYKLVVLRYFLLACFCFIAIILQKKFDFIDRIKNIRKN